MALPDSVSLFFQSNSLCVVDAGARNGIVDFKRLAKWMKVYAFEPDIEEALELEKINPGYDFYLVSPLALASRAGERTLHLTRARSFSSFLSFDKNEFIKHFGRMKDAEKWMRAFEVEHALEISCITLDDMFSEDEIDFLKLDTQGTELEILHGAKNLLDKKQLSVIEVEVNMQPVYKGQPSFSVIDLFLRAAGFLLVDYRINPNAFGVHRSNNRNENPRIANGGDAIYMLDMHLLPAEEQNARALKSALLLAHKGCLSASEYLFRTFTKISSAEIDEIFSTLNAKTGKERRKDFARRWLPPGLISLLK